MFLWHYPHGRPHWALPSKSGLSGARTFLKFTQGKFATTCAYSFGDHLSVACVLITATEDVKVGTNARSNWTSIEPIETIELNGVQYSRRKPTLGELL
jgi:hypothetical protein